MKGDFCTEASSKHTQTQPNIPPLGDIANDVSCHAWRKTLLGRLLPNREADAKCPKALMHFGRACELRFSTGRGTHPDPIRQAVSFKNRLGWEISWHSNRHALRIAIERKVRSKIR